MYNETKVVYFSIGMKIYCYFCRGSKSHVQIYDLFHLLLRLDWPAALGLPHPCAGRAIQPYPLLCAHASLHGATPPQHKPRERDLYEQWGVLEQYRALCAEHLCLNCLNMTELGLPVTIVAELLPPLHQQPLCQPA